MDESSANSPVLPDYDGACTSNVMRPLIDDPAGAPSWFPQSLEDVDQVVLLVLDGLGWHQMQMRSELLRGLTRMAATCITTVAPTTTATALTSISTGLPPGEHGVIGYRMHVDGDDVLNVLRWATTRGDARESIPPESVQPDVAFGGQRPPIVVRAEFRDSGFTRAHLGGCRVVPYRMPSTLVAEIGHQLAQGEPFVYAYYDGIDKVAHEYGLGPCYDAELVFVDRMVEYLVDTLPAGAALVITADHGHVDVSDVFPPHPEVMSHVRAQSGEARFRWLHATAGAELVLYDAAVDHHADVAWVVTRDQVLDECWFGPKVLPGPLARLGDVALVARDDVAFEDPADSGPFELKGRHGSMTAAEVHVPLLVART